MSKIIFGLIIALVFTGIFCLIVSDFSDSSSSKYSKMEKHKCSYYGCTDGSYDLELSGNYYCFKHYNKMLFG